MKHLGAALICCCNLAWAQPLTTRHLGTIHAGPSLHVVAFGDWGYRGSGSGQAEVAAAVRKAHAAAPFQLGLTLGDNFYPSGVRSVHDPLWAALWEGGYAKLAIPFFATLGNHDYQGNEQAEIDYTRQSKTWRMPFNYYTFVAGSVQFFALDTDEGTAGRIFFRKPWSDEQAHWLDSELARSTATWKVVYGHHPIYSDGHHGDGKRLQAKLLPILKANRVDVYLCGHEHELQFHERDGMQFLIVGGGGKDTRKVKARRAKFAASRNGFLDVTATPGQLAWRIRSTDGTTLSAATLVKPRAPATVPAATVPARTRSVPTSPRR